MLEIITDNIQNVDWSKYPVPQCIVTSPPYYAKRYYAEAGQQWWGGDNNCKHKPSGNTVAPAPGRYKEENENQLLKVKPGTSGADPKTKKPHDVCECGAWLGQLGQEPNPQMFVEHLADTLTSLPLKDDGILWVNIDDTWARGAAGGQPKEGTMYARMVGDRKGKTERPKSPMSNSSLGDAGLKTKDLCLVPQRLAIAMQERGWWVRSQICWQKSNAMPQSCKDRPPHEYEVVFMFTKSKHYTYYPENVVIKTAESTYKRLDRGRNAEFKEGIEPQGLKKHFEKKRKEKYAPGSEYTSKKGFHSPEKREAYANGDYKDTRSIRDVWTMATAQSRTEHIAPMPSELARRCILLSTKFGDVVLDPFAGSGTTAKVALNFGREAIAVDIDKRLKDWISGIQQGIGV